MACENAGPFSVCSLVIITGASGGFGSELSKSFAQNLQENSLLVMTGRNCDKVAEVSKQITDVVGNKIQIKVSSCDLSEVSSIDAFFDEFERDINLSSFKSAILINNAGTLGDVSLKIDQYEYLSMKREFDINVTNTLYFTTKYLKKISEQNIIPSIINITSLCAIKPFPYCGTYCTTKAARDMMFKVLAAERKDVTVLSWAPGPMPTQMMIELSKADAEEVSSANRKMLENHTYVKCRASAEKLISLLKTNDFVSGDHVDYYDV